MFCDYQCVEEAPVSIEPGEVLRFQGYRADPGQVQEGIQRLVQSQIDHSYRLIQPQALSKGLALTPRISPGYGDLTLQEQKIVFALLSGDRIGVTLTEKCVMQPRKSVSFAMGMGEGFTIKKSVGRCCHCGMINCPYRLD